MSPSPPERLTEHVPDWRSAGGDLAIDVEHRLVRNVALTGLVSKNGYRYREAALREALGLYADKPVFLDHAPRGDRPFERSARDLVGSISEPRFALGRVRADVRVLDTEAGRTFLALARANGPAVGMSHVVLAERSPDGQHVEKLHDVVCVDAVVFPATTSTFQEGLVEGRFTTGTPTVDGSLEALLAEADAALPAWCERSAIAGISVKRVGLFPEHLLVDVRTEEGTVRRAIAWTTDDHGLVLGETVDTPAPASFVPALHDLRERLAETTRERDEFGVRLERLESEQRHTERVRRILSPERRDDPTVNLDDRLVAAIRRAA